MRPAFACPAVASLLLCLSPAFAADAGLDPARVPTLEQDLLLASHHLAQTGYSEFDALGERTIHETRFIPNSVSVYSYREDGKARIVIHVGYRHAGAITTREAAQQTCDGMVRWARFHLGVKDDGQALIAHASPFDSSTLHRWVGTADAAGMDQVLAASVDAATTVVGEVLPVRGGMSASCRQPLVAPGAQPRIDLR